MDPAIDIIEQALDYVNQLIDVAFAQARGVLNILLSQIDQVRVGALKIADQEIQRQSQLITKLIDSVKNQSSDRGLDILECLENIETEIGAIEKEAVNSSMLCIDDTIKIIGKDVLEIVDDLTKIHKNFTEEEGKLDNCKGKLLPFDCVKQVLTDLGDIALGIPAQINLDVEKAAQNFAGLGFKVFQCVNQATDIMQQEGVQVFNNFSQCVFNKQHKELWK